MLLLGDLGFPAPPEFRTLTGACRLLLRDSVVSCHAAQMCLLQDSSHSLLETPLVSRMFFVFLHQPSWC